MSHILLLRTSMIFQKKKIEIKLDKYKSLLKEIYNPIF